MIVEWTLVALALGTSGLLAYIMSFGIRRRRRLETFARRHGGTYALEPDAALREAHTTSSELIGTMVRLDRGDRDLYLFDRHADPRTGPCATCCWIPQTSQALSDPETLELDTLLEEESRMHLERQGWHLEFEPHEQGWRVCSRGRALHSADEWRTLLACADALADHLEEDST